MKKKMRCWEFLECKQGECPAYQSDDLECWLIPGTHCRSQVQGEFLEKMDLCLECEHFTENLDENTMLEMLKVANEQVAAFRKMVEARDKELEEISMELAIGLSEVFEALKVIYSGDPSVRIAETSELELISKLKHMVNLTAKNCGEIVNLSHEFAIGLAEHFDVLHRVSKGDLSARVLGTSELELLEALKNVTNQTIWSVAEEISERKRAEKALKASQTELMESEEKYRSLFDSGPDPIFVLDRETLEILDANTSAEETYGYSKEELIGHCFVELGLFGDDEMGLSFFSTEIADSGLMYSKVRHYKKGHETFYVNVHFSPTRYKEMDAIIVSVTDITEMIEKEAQLIQASKMTTLGEMSAGIAHELNQPLNAIKMGNEYLKMMIEAGKIIPGKNLYQVVNEVSDQVDRAANIIDRLREFGRKADFSREKVDINRSVRDVLVIIGHQLSLQNIEVELHMDQTIPPVLAHKNRLEQVIFNMLTNARDAISQKKESEEGKDKRVITIRSLKDNDQVVLFVSDTGIGIPEHNRDKIFEPFFTSKEVGNGMGLGLYITYGIVMDYGGEIGVQSEEGKGSTFRISFPQMVA